MLADELDYVVGVDTHRDEHVLAVVVAPAGAVSLGGRSLRMHAATRRRCASLTPMRVVGASGQLKALAITVRRSLAI